MLGSQLFNDISNSDIQTSFGQKNCKDKNYAPLSFDEYAPKFSVADGVEDIHYLSSILCEKYGFESFSVVVHMHRKSTSPLLFHMIQSMDSFTKSYEKNKNIVDDPMLRVSSLTVSPYFYRDSFENIEFSQKESEIMENYLDAGMHDFVLFPFHELTGDYGLVRFFDNKNECVNLSSRLSGDELSELAILSHYMYTSLKSVLSKTKKNSDVVLSRREKEVLVWTSRGNNPACIGDMLNISDNTVRNHLKNIRSKLGVRNITHAVAKAISSRAILF